MNSLDLKMRSKLLRLQLLLGENGNELREPYSKYLEDGIFELRVQQGQQTPKRVIKLAKKYRQEYLEEVGKGNE